MRLHLLEFLLILLNGCLYVLLAEDSAAGGLIRFLSCAASLVHKDQVSYVILLRLDQGVRLIRWLL